MNNQEIKIGDKVKAVTLKNGYFQNSYKGTVIGFAKNGRIKVESYLGIKIHSKENITII